MVDELIKHLISRLDVGGVSLLIIIIGAVYIWYQHNSNKLLREEIELERKKRKDFLEANLSGQLKTISPGQSIKHPKNILDILCVDDEELVRDLVGQTLRISTTNTRIDTAANGEEALGKCSDHPPAILVTDIMMPRMNGIELINSLRRKYVNLPILIISGYASSRDIEERGIKLNENTIFLRKPFRAEEFMSALKKLVDKLNNGGKLPAEGDGSTPSR
jgi:CheY-like chemotaxis protein